MDPVQVSDIGLGMSIYTQEQLDEFARFQDSQGTRKAYLAETAEMAYIGRNERGEWGLALSTDAQGSLIDIVGANFFPLYRVIGPMIFFVSLFLLVWGGGFETCGHSFGKSGSNSQVQGVRAMGADGAVGHPVPAGNLAVQLNGCGHGGSWRASRGDDGD